MRGLRSSVFGLRSPVCSSAERRRGLSVVELLAVMTIAGIFMAIAIPHGMKMLDRISVHAAVGDLAMMLASAREFAIGSHSSVSVGFAGSAGVTVKRGSEVLFSRNIAS